MTRHPWNVNFEWQPHPGPHRRLSDELGFVVIEDAVDAGTLERVTVEIDGFENELERFLRTQRIETRIGPGRGATGAEVRI